MKKILEPNDFTDEFYQMFKEHQSSTNSSEKVENTSELI